LKTPWTRYPPPPGAPGVNGGWWACICEPHTFTKSTKAKRNRHPSEKNPPPKLIPRGPPRERFVDPMPSSRPTVRPLGGLGPSPSHSPWKAVPSPPPRPAEPVLPSGRPSVGPTGCVWYVGGGGGQGILSSPRGEGRGLLPPLPSPYFGQTRRRRGVRRRRLPSFTAPLIPFSGLNYQPSERVANPMLGARAGVSR